jgi:hypothetical protein
MTGKYGAIIAASVFPAGALIRGGSAVKGSTALKVYGAVNRPLLTLGVHQGIRGANTAMALSKGYSKMMLAASVFGFAKNVQLARAREWKRLGINVMGPPGSLFAYNNYISRNQTVEDVREAFEQISMPVNSPDSPKSYQQGEDSGHQRKSKSYRPKSGHRCAKGYRKINGMCVKQ